MRTFNLKAFLALIVSLSLLTVSCSKKDDNNPQPSEAGITGVWNLTEITYRVLLADSLIAEDRDTVFAEGYLTFVFNEDGTGTAQGERGDIGEGPVSFTYEIIDNNKLKLQSGNETELYDITELTNANLAISTTGEETEDGVTYTYVNTIRFKRQ